MSPSMATPTPQPALSHDGSLPQLDETPSTPIAPDGRELEGTASNSRPLSNSRKSTARLSRTNTQNARDKDTKSPPKSPTSEASVALDPLSKQIYLRTNSNTEPPPSIAQRLRNPGRPESPNTESGQGQSSEPANTVDATKEWR
jgi:hypothetical protein